MSRRLIRRAGGLWLGVAVATGAWLIGGPRLILLSLPGALLLPVAERTVWRLMPPRRTRRRRVPLAWASVAIAGTSLSLAAAAQLAAPVERVIGATRELHPLGGGPASALARTHLAAPWGTVIDLLVGIGLISSMLVARALRRPDPLPGERSQAALEQAREVVERYGEDSLSPFIPRPDKSFEFAGGGVAAYAVFGETVVVSGDPVGPHGAASEAIAQLVLRARRAGLGVAIYGASDRHLATYRALGLRCVCVGEEAVVNPAQFTLEGRPVRKLRQSVHRVGRRGWRIAILEGREIDAALEAAIDAVEAAWRAERERVLGFAMSMGSFELGVRPDDVYVLAFSPEQRLQAVMRFLAHRGNLSLDTMHRVGETPNGLNEVLVCQALEFARTRGVAQVSLNYAGLAHLVRRRPSANPAVRMLTGALVKSLGTHFQMQRLVQFNEKFSPLWRPRYLVYESRTALPRAVLRVLQAEGYMPQGSKPPRERPAERWSRPRSRPIETGIGG
jgi:lysyl-tRNA synthetase, class II